MSVADGETSRLFVVAGWGGGGGESSNDGSIGWFIERSDGFADLSFMLWLLL